MAGIQVEVVLEATKVAGGEARSMQALVRLTAPRQASTTLRPSVELVACVDVSGSMQGAKLQEVKASVARLIGQLDGRDRLGLVSFSSETEGLLPLVAMDPPGRQRGLDAVAALRTRGNTRMSAGLSDSLELLRDQPGDPSAMRRVLLFTDGHANAGLSQRDTEGWAALVREKLGDASVSWFGYGEGHDAAFLAWLADRTKGNAHVASDVDAIADAFARELGGLLGTTARDVRVEVVGVDGAPMLLNDESVTEVPGGVRVSLADLSSEERKDLVFALPVGAGSVGDARRVIDVAVSWIDARSGRPDSVRVTGEVTFVDATQADAPATEVLEATFFQQSAAVLQKAANLARQGDFEGARVVVLEHAQRVRQLPTDRARALHAKLLDTAACFDDERSFSSSHSRRTSLSRSVSKQRPSGSELDGLYETGAQQRMRQTFGGSSSSSPRPPKRRLH